MLWNVTNSNVVFFVLIAHHYVSLVYSVDIHPNEMCLNLWNNYVYLDFFLLSINIIIHIATGPVTHTFHEFTRSERYLLQQYDDDKIHALGLTYHLPIGVTFSVPISLVDSLYPLQITSDDPPIRAIIGTKILTRRANQPMSVNWVCFSKLNKENVCWSSS